jgi:hypothetical protein
VTGADHTFMRRSRSIFTTAVVVSAVRVGLAAAVVVSVLIAG